MGGREVTRACESCGTQFTATRSDARFCTRPCYRRWRYNKNPDRFRAYERERYEKDRTPFVAAMSRYWAKNKDRIRRLAREKARVRRALVPEAPSPRDPEYGRRQRARWPQRIKARRVVQGAVQRGEIPSCKSLPCTDCGGTAQHYDHYLGYERDHWLDVQPVCIRCHGERSAIRGEYHRKRAA